jgi:hypothetical protein
MSKQKAPSYRSYLIRCWREGTAGVWRYSVEDIFDEQQRRGFGCVADLLVFLQEELAGQVDQSPGERIVYSLGEMRSTAIKEIKEYSGNQNLS